jgi:hypothetical protein
MRRIALAVALAAVVAYADLSASSPVSPPATETLASASAVNGRIRGTVTGLYPGVRRRIAVRIHNDFGQSVIVVRLRTRVKDASPACGRRYLKAKRVSRPRTIPPQANRRIAVRVRLVRVRLLRSAPDACQGATFPLRFRATFARR